MARAKAKRKTPGKPPGSPKPRQRSKPNARGMLKPVVQPTRRSDRIAAQHATAQTSVQQAAVAMSARAAAGPRPASRAQQAINQQQQPVSPSSTVVNPQDTGNSSPLPPPNLNHDCRSAARPDGVGKKKVHFADAVAGPSTVAGTAAVSSKVLPGKRRVTRTTRQPVSILKRASKPKAKGKTRGRTRDGSNGGPQPAAAPPSPVRPKRKSATVDNVQGPKPKRHKARSRQRIRSPKRMPRVRLPFRKTTWNPAPGAIKDMGDICIYCNIPERRVRFRCARCRELLYCSDDCRKADNECHLLICQKLKAFIEKNESPARDYYRALLLPAVPESEYSDFQLSPVELIWVKINRTWQDNDRVLIDIVHHEIVEDVDGEKERVDLLTEPNGPYAADMTAMPGIFQVLLNKSRTLHKWPIGHGLGMISLDGQPYNPLGGANYEPDQRRGLAFADEFDQSHMWKGNMNTFMGKLHLAGAMYIETGPRIIFSFIPDMMGTKQILQDLTLRDFRYVVDYFRNNPKNPRLNEVWRCSHTDPGIPALQIMDLTHPVTKFLEIKEEFHRIIAPLHSRWDAGLGYCLIPYFLGLPWIFRPGPLTAKSMAYGFLGSADDPNHGAGFMPTLTPLTYFLNPVFNDNPRRPTHWVITRHSQHESGIIFHASHKERVEPIHVQALCEYFYRKIVEPQMKNPDDKIDGLWFSRAHFQAFWREYLVGKFIDPQHVTDPWEGADEEADMDDDLDDGRRAHYHHHDEVMEEIAKRGHKLWFHQPAGDGAVPGIGMFGPSVDHPGDVYGDINFQTWGELKPPGSERMQQNEHDWLWHYDRITVEEEMARHRRGRLDPDPTRSSSSTTSTPTYDDPLDWPAFKATKGKFFFGKVTDQSRDYDDDTSSVYSD